MENIPNCPKCSSEYTYEDRGLYACPECFHEWTEVKEEEENSKEKSVEIIRDAHGTELQTGDDVTITKDLRVKGASKALKIGTLVKDIVLLYGNDVVDGHNIDCRIKGFGDMRLKSEIVKKA